MNGRSTILAPVIGVTIGVLWMFVQVFSPEPKANGFNMAEFAEIPCQANGRVKPLDTFARTNLMIISGRQTFVDENDQEHSAIEWLADVMVSGERYYNPERDSGIPKAFEHRVFRIDSEQLINMLGLEPRSGFRYSWIELITKNKKFVELSKTAAKKDPKNLDEADIKLRELGKHVAIFHILAALKVPDLEDLDNPKDLGLIPPSNGSDVWGALFQKSDSDQDRARRDKLDEMLVRYKQGRQAEFNKVLSEYSKDIAETRPGDTGKADFETFFNHFAPFYWCSMVYLVVIAMCFVSWMAWTKPLTSAAFWLTLFALCIHTFALIARIYIQSRPPVTNLYSSAVFIGWGCVGLCLFLEFLFGNGIANVGAAILGASTLFIAHFLGSEGDTMEMLQAVLDTNFWLATHVVCVTFGYTATFVAGTLGMIFVIRGVFTPSLDKETVKALGQAIYGVLCFATLLSFTGTVLGGIWADQSWGRFWGWDPKENGAVLIVIWNAIILHARWAGLVKERGMAVATVFGNMMTAWSWFGTNQLGVGLHAYGFNKHLATGCAIFWIFQAMLIVVGVLPLKYWWSFNDVKYSPPPVSRV